MINYIVGLTALLFNLGCAASDVPATTPVGTGAGAGPADSTPLSRDSSIDRILDALDARGDGLRSFVADVTLTESDPDTGDESTRTGKVWLDTSDADSTRFRATFDKKLANNRIVEDRIEYLLDGGNLIDRTYRTKTQVTRQVLRPGEKINLLRLGEGPFPLPIGQARQEVHKLFDVSKLEPRADDPPNTVHISLVPRPGTQFERKFKSIDAWVDLSDHMPKRIETVDPNGTTVRTTDLSNVRLNAAQDDTEFTLPPIDGSWTLLDEAYQR